MEVALGSIFPVLLISGSNLFSFVNLINWFLFLIERCDMANRRNAKSDAFYK